LAKDLELPKVYADLPELLSDDEVQIVEIAVPASRQPEIACKVLGSAATCCAQSHSPKNTRVPEKLLSWPMFEI
jgi:hypothetical protein